MSHPKSWAYTQRWYLQCCRGMGGAEKGATESSSGSVRGLSYANCKLSGLMFALGTGQKRENQKFLFCSHCWGAEWTEKEWFRENLREMSETEMQEWNLDKKGAAQISTGLQGKTPVLVKLQDALSLNSLRSRFYPEFIERISESFRDKIIIQDLLYLQNSHETTE